MIEYKVFVKIMSSILPPSRPSDCRNSSVESLRIIAIIMIISMHLMGKWWQTHSMINREMIIFLNAIFNTGNTLFILISGYYGIKLRARKVFRLWFMTLTYTIPLFFLTWAITREYGGPRFVVNSFLPIMTNYKWFATSYILLTLISPFINSAFDNLKKSDKEKVLCIGCMFFVVAPTLLFTGILKDGGKGIVNMLLVYLLGRYVRLHGVPPFLNTHGMAKGILLILIIFGGNSLFSLMTNHIIGYFAYDSSIFIVCLSLVIFKYFINKEYHSKMINRLATYCFPIYLFSDIVWLLFADTIKSYMDKTTCWLMMPLFIVVAVVLSVVYENIRKATFGKIEERVFVFLKDKMKNYCR